MLAATLLNLAPSARALDPDWEWPTDPPTWRDHLGVTIEKFLSVLMPYRAENAECQKHWRGCRELVWESNRDYNALRSLNDRAIRMVHECVDNSTRASAATRVIVDDWETCRTRIWVSGWMVE